MTDVAMHTPSWSYRTAAPICRLLGSILLGGVLVAVSSIGVVSAEECDEACQRLRETQDPLANVSAVMTDNTIAIGTADDKTSYGFQVQPVHSFEIDQDLNYIARGIIPIIGVQEGAGLPPLGTEPAGGSGLTWGLGDVIIQNFFVPQTDGAIKFGIGPQVSLRTRTDSAVGGPGWGIGVSAVAFGFAGDLSYGAILGQHWGESDFSLTMLQPIVFYNTGFLGGSYIGYNNSITYDWSASSGNRWQVPVGVTVGKTFLFDSGEALDLNIGTYWLAEKPTGGADSQIKFGISWFFN